MRWVAPMERRMCAVAQDVAQRHGLKYRRVFEPAPGKHRALNTALESVMTPLVVTVDADTLLHPQALTYAAHGRAQPPAGCVACGVRYGRRSASQQVDPDLRDHGMHRRRRPTPRQRLFSVAVKAGAGPSSGPSRRLLRPTRRQRLTPRRRCSPSAVLRRQRCAGCWRRPIGGEIRAGLAGDRGETH